jgi:hypothetical protein
MNGKRVISLCILLGGLLVAGALYASDGDLQQYSRAAANAEAANAGNALTGPLLLATDGKLISADSNASGKAPVNRGLRQLADYVTGVRCAFTGECASVNQRTAKSLQVDGTGGQVASAPAGSIVASGYVQASGSASSTTAPTASVAPGQVYRDGVVLCWARAYWNGTSMVLQRGYNVRSVVRVGAGVYDISCNSAATDPLTSHVQITLGINPNTVTNGFTGNVAFVSADLSNRPIVEINTIDAHTSAFVDTSSTSPLFVTVTGY